MVVTWNRRVLQEIARFGDALVELVIDVQLVRLVELIHEPYVDGIHVCGLEMKVLLGCSRSMSNEGVRVVASGKVCGWRRTCQKK